MIFVFGEVEHIVGKGENDGYHCSISHNVFKRVFTRGRLKSGLCDKELINNLKSLVNTAVRTTVVSMFLHGDAEI